MKKIITLVAALAIVSSPAFAATKKTTKTKTTTTTTSSSPTYSSSPAYSSSSTGSGPMFSAKFGLGTAITKFHFGLGFNMDFPVNMEGNNFRFGGETGFYFGPSSPSTWIIPILATGYYDFRVSSGTLKPYVGIGLGISIAHVSVSSLGITASATSTDFAFKATPGTYFGDEGKMFAELPLGVMGSEFFILPSVGMKL